MKQQQLEWRRSQVLELAGRGYSQREIARELQVDLAAVNRDIQFLRQRAEEICSITFIKSYQKNAKGMY